MGKYSNILMEHFLQPRNCGPMEHPECIGLVGLPGQGPFFLLCLRVQDKRILEGRFQTHGCGASIACGSMLTGMIANRSIDECLGLTEEQLAQALDGVPPDKLHCPAMAIGALRHALKNYRERRATNQTDQDRSGL